MRPIRLEMDGFASFRTATTIDFEGADYFALVGPTGSGKSTVIDAMVFALYGSAPRWGRVNSVQYALAPTATRATVRLVFDVGANRYQIAREVRRSGQQIAQKSASLERFLDPSLARATTDHVQVIASEVREVTPAVEALLGLSFEDFTKAVVLPQGRFAEFLTAKASDRQEILLKLLGAHQYELIMQAAGRRKSAADTELVGLEATLGELAYATPEAETAAAARLSALSDLRERVAELLGERAHAQTGERDARDRVRAEAEAAALLASIVPPTDLDRLQEQSRLVRNELATARARENSAAKAFAQARAALEEAGSRSHLEQHRAAWQELDDLRRDLPALQAAVDDAATQVASAREAQTAAETAWTEALAAERASAESRDAAAKLVSQLTARQSAIVAVAAPEGLEDLTERLESAAAAAATATTALEEAESADEQAREALSAAGDLATIDQLLAQLREYEALRERFREQAAATAEAEAARADADRATRDADAALEALTAQAEGLAVQSVAATLRSHLVVGESCPVCAQAVTDLPSPIELAEADELRRQVTAAKLTKTEADKQAIATAVAAAAAAKEVEATQARLAQLTTLLPGGGSLDAGALRADLATARERCAQARTAADSASRALLAARQRRKIAVGAEEALEHERRAAWDAMNRARADVVGLGAPISQTENIQQAWDELLGWARDQLAVLEGEHLPAATAALAQADDAYAAAEAALGQCATARARATERREAATRQSASAESDCSQAERRVAQLGDLLASAPSADQVAVQLSVLAEREQAEKAALAAHGEAVGVRELAEQAERSLEDSLREARALLRVTRDRLVPLGAPALDDESDLPSAWNALAAWAAAAEESAKVRLAEADAAHRSASAALLEVEHQMLRAADEHAIQAAVAGEVESAVAAAHGLAAERVDAIRNGLRRRDELEARKRDATDRSRVAGLLAEHLNARKFQRWLAGAALDVLVEAASDSLFELSGKQFGLTHDNGEFFVIDHADAEARRSVRTLSGGETFQASLALALALSAELSSLSSGAARLDSIFLDEGFGSLDPDSLEVVAVTLERLAQGDRMVGLITHVQGLAERVPTRFRVNRTSRTSTVEREG